MFWQFFSSCIFFSAASLHRSQTSENFDSLPRVPSGPEKIRKKQDDRECASCFKLLEEPRQKISKDKTLEAVYQGRNNESKGTQAGIRFRGRGSEEKNGNSRKPGKNEKDQGFANHPPARRSFLGFISTLFAHKPKIHCPASDGREKTATKYESVDRASNPWVRACSRTF
jgi:hypothetical protein